MEVLVVLLLTLVLSECCLRLASASHESSFIHMIISQGKKIYVYLYAHKSHAQKHPQPLMKQNVFRYN